MTRVAYVSGGGTGIGRATVAALARDDWAVVVLGRRPDPLAGTVEAVTDEVAGAELHAVTADLAEPDQVERAVADAAAAAGRLADLGAGDAVLVKGSRVAGLEAVADALLAG